MRSYFVDQMEKEYSQNKHLPFLMTHQMKMVQTSYKHALLSSTEHPLESRRTAKSAKKIVLFFGTYV